MLNYLQHASAYFSVWTLTLMAADRFLAVCYPVESMTLRNPLNTCIALAVVYTIILLSQIQVGKMHDVYDYTFIVENRSTCSIVSIAKGEATVVEARLYFFSFNIFGYVLPLGITCILYYLMLKRLWYTPRPGGSNKNISGSVRSRPETVRAKRKVTRLVLCVVVIWAVCWFPLNLCFFFSGVVYPDTLVMRGGKPLVIIQIASQVLAYANSCLNPILYALVSDNFRKGFVKIACVAINRLTFGKCCRSRIHCNSRMEVTFYNGSNSNRLSRTNSSHRTQQIITENSSLLLRSPMTGSSPGLTEVANTADSPVISTPKRTGKPFPRAASSLAGRIQNKPKIRIRAQRIRTFDDISST
uniref:G-protein coupled receptors family 1 profile domain-containing protein n=1 Tax=Panagrolaimus sp. JU765 TaxID=591449 RepID=A0AC34PUZ3_9BILA